MATQYKLRSSGKTTMMTPTMLANEAKRKEARVEQWHAKEQAKPTERNCRLLTDADDAELAAWHKRQKQNSKERKVIGVKVYGKPKRRMPKPLRPTTSATMISKSGM